MHLAINILVLFVTWKWSDRHRWRDYHTTMLFMPLMTLVYNFIAFSSGFFLWKPRPDFLFNHAIVELTYTAILMPCTALLFLSHYPKAPINIFLHFMKFIFVYSSVEAFLHLMGRMDYQHGWSIWHSVFFYFLMFPSIIIHHKKPLLAYIIFILITAFGVWYFKMPIK